MIEEDSAPPFRCFICASAQRLRSHPRFTPNGVGETHPLEVPGTLLYQRVALRPDTQWYVTCDVNFQKEPFLSHHAPGARPWTRGVESGRKRSPSPTLARASEKKAASKLASSPLSSLERNISRYATTNVGVCLSVCATSPERCAVSFPLTSNASRIWGERERLRLFFFPSPSPFVHPPPPFRSPNISRCSP